MTEKLWRGGSPSRKIFDHLRGDVRFAMRSLARVPGFTAVALMTLVIGIASVTTLFSFVYAYAFRPLPYRDANRIVSIQELRPRGFSSTSISLPAARAILNASHSFERVTLFRLASTRAAIRGQARDLQSLRVDSSFIPMFGVQPQRGRTITTDEITANAPVVMISDVLWRTTFGSDSSIIGRPQQFGQELLTIVGVMPVGFRYPYQTDLWRPLASADTSDASVILLGKIARASTRVAVSNEMMLIANQLARSDSQQFFGTRLVASEMVDRRIGGALPLTAAFVGASLLVLLIACSNVANLFLIRAAERRGEMAVRAALGAGRARLLAQTLTESLILAVVAGALGALLSMAMTQLILAVIPTSGFPSWLVFGMDTRILLFVVACITLVTIAVGLAPAREGARFDLVRALKVGGDGGSVKSGVGKAARRGIVVQLALSVVLFVGAALLVRTYQKLAKVDVGYPAAEIVSLQPLFDPVRYASDTSQLRFATAVLSDVRGLAGARQVAIRGTFVAPSPADRSAQTSSRRRIPDSRLFVDGDTTRALGRSLYPSPRYSVISDEYFQTLGLRVVRGRGFATDDLAGSQPVVVISQRFADLFWPHENPLGHTLQLGPQGTRFTVIGIVQNVRDLFGGSRGYFADPLADAYMSVRQVSPTHPEILIRAFGGVTPVQSGAQAIARRLDANVSITASTLAHNLEQSLLATRIVGVLIGVFALCGLALCVIGIYGVVGYGIAQRTREIGIRIALGGTSRDVIRLVLRQALAFVAVGLAIGLVLSLGAGRLIRTLLFGVSPVDPVTYGVVCIVCGGVALLACYLPARRVTRVDPLVALRAD